MRTHLLKFCFIFFYAYTGWGDRLLGSASSDPYAPNPDKYSSKLESCVSVFCRGVEIKAPTEYLTTELLEKSREGSAKVELDIDPSEFHAVLNHLRDGTKPPNHIRDILWNLGLTKHARKTLFSYKSGMIGSSSCVIKNHFLIAGGSSDEEEPIEPKVTLYNPISGITKDCAPLHKGVKCAAACLHNDAFYVYGGLEQEPPETNSCTQVYDPERDAWTLVNDQRSELKVIEHRSGSMVSHEGQIYLLGGRSDSLKPHDTTIYRYDPREGFWQQPSHLLMRGFRQGAVASVGSIIMLTGGLTTDHITSATNRTFLYDPRGRYECCVETPPLVRPLASHSIIDPQSTTHLLFGGFDQNLDWQHNIYERVGDLWQMTTYGVKAGAYTVHGLVKNYEQYND